MTDDTSAGSIYDRLRYVSEPASTDPEIAFTPQLPYLDRVVSLRFPAERNARILELGCGAGPLIFAARRRGYTNIAGVDATGSQVSLARQLGIPGVAQGDALATLQEQPARTCDCIITWDVLEHLPLDRLLDVASEVSRVLAPRGSWIIHVPNGESPFVGRILYGDITHYRAFTRESLEQLLFGAGFQEVDIFEDRPIVHGLKSSIRRVGWELLRNLARAWLTVETGQLRGHIVSQNLLAVARHSSQA